MKVRTEANVVVTVAHKYHNDYYYSVTSDPSPSVNCIILS
jgi:hypothetical protein